MYLSFYGLARPPFETEPQPEPFFAAPDHVEALRGLIYGITENRGFISITGEPGVGKTKVLRAAAQSLGLTHPSLVWVECADPEIAPATLLATVGDRLNLPAALTVDADLAPFRNRLLRLREAGRSLVMVFDHAERLSRDTLAFIERLAALQTEDAPLFLVVFIANSNWQASLRREEYAAIDRRIAVRVEISALAPRLARAYLEFRLTAAGGTVAEVMTAGAIHAIAAQSGGIPHRIHVLADQALGNGAANGRRPVAAADVRALIPPKDGLRAVRRRPGWHSVVAAIAAATVTVLAVVLGVTVGIHRFDAATHPLPPPAADLAPAGAPPPPSPLPTANPPATSTGSPPVTPTAPVAAPTLSLPDAAIAAPEPGSGPRTPAVKSNVTVTVVAGDSLMAILRRASLPASAAELRIIHQLNPLLGSGNLIHPGQRIVLPAGPAH